MPPIAAAGSIWAKRGVERRSGAGGLRSHTTHLTVGGRCREHRRQHADDQQSVRRAIYRSRYGHDPEQLHVRVRSAARTGEFVAPGKRVTSSMSPVIVAARRQAGLRSGPAGRPADLPVSVMQALSNLIDHGMSVQEAVEAPRIWTQGHALELEAGIPPTCPRRWRTRATIAVGRQRRGRDERDPIP